MFVMFFVHNNCRKLLHNEVNCNSVQAQNEASKPILRRQIHTRKADEEFKWRINCFICGKVFEIYRDKQSLCDIKKKNFPESTKESVISMVRVGSDQQFKAIFYRLSSCSDLPVVEARYHIECRNRLKFRHKYTNRNKTPCDKRTKNFNRLCM